MSSSLYSYGSSYSQDKSKSYAPRSTNSSESPSTVRTAHSLTTSASSPTSSSSLYAHRGHSTRNNRYGSKPSGTVIHNDGGQSSGPNSTSAGNSGYYQ
ncbi:hypothetical protein PMIN01_06413 [Paraphaeosphaeria minitans]|uniref:Uncharacterized protein n=1 Tax=Paraphaeosphaeria minitans TaxID=565426 RepID=A0A9P6KPS4_9PLEO|nr:hypothetical protein PMIN01_06413 [Paraphaeosphaeria minitans]